MKKNKIITVRVLSVFFAIILWFYVMEQENPKITKEIPNVKVELVNGEYLNQSNLVLADTNEYEITVKISGRRNEIINVTEKDIIAKADIAGYQEGDSKVPIEVVIPSKSEVLSDFYPKNILLKLDKVVERQVPVNLYLKGSVRIGYSTGDPVIKQRNILIRGPKSILDLVHEAKATVNLNSESSDIDIKTPITLVDVNNNEIIQEVSKEPNVVDVYIPILKVKSIDIDANIVGSPLNGYQLTSNSINPTRVKVRGKEADILKISSLKTEVININGLSQSVDIDVPLIIPKNIELLENKEEVNVIVNIEKIIKKSFEFSVDDIAIYNLDIGLEIDKNQIPENIKIEVQGIESKIKELSKSDIKTYINVEELTEGTHEVELEIVKPYGVDILKTVPNKFNITLLKESEVKEDEVKEDDVQDEETTDDITENDI